MTFKQVNRFPLGTKMTGCYDCRAILEWYKGGKMVSSQEFAPGEEITLVHKCKNGYVHWFKPETDLYVLNKILNPIQILEFTASIDTDYGRDSDGEDVL